MQFVNCTQTVDPDQMLRSVVSDLELLCLPMNGLRHCQQKLSGFLFPSMHRNLSLKQTNTHTDPSLRSEHTRLRLVEMKDTLTL